MDRLCALPPERAALAAGAALGRATGLLRVRRRTAERQVAAAFPERSPAWVRRTVRACYAHFGREAVATGRLARRGPEALVERVENVPHTREVLAEASRGGGLLLVTGHLGNWELAGACAGALGRPLWAVARRQTGPLEAWLAARRARLGVGTIPEDRAARDVLRALRDGHTVALVADQHAVAGRGVVVPFLGRPASTFRGPARLALRAGVPLAFGGLVRAGEGYRALLEPVAVPGAGEEDAELRLTRRWVACLEAAVRDWPAQYFWFHRRWKAAEAAREAGTAPPVGGRWRGAEDLARRAGTSGPAGRSKAGRKGGEEA